MMHVYCDDFGSFKLETHRQGFDYELFYKLRQYQRSYFTLHLVQVNNEHGIAAVLFRRISQLGIREL